MISRKLVLIVCICCIAASVVIAKQVEQRKPKRPVERAKRPLFEKKDWDGVFFEDLFRDGLRGERPIPAEHPQTDGSMSPGNTVTVAAGSWSELIEGPVLENEVKRWQLEVSSLLTTPIRFKTSHTDIGEKFSLLAMLFAIIGNYEDDVRWKDAAHSARAAFVTAASKCRGTDMSAFNHVKQSSQDLDELVRGGKFPEDPAAKDEISDWSSVIDRNPIMIRLELSVSEELKEATSSESSFKSDSDLVVHEASMIAAMGRVLQLPEMYDAEEEDYRALADQMVVAAQEMRAAAKAGNLELVNQSLNRINQSCVNCHADWQ